MRYLWLVLLLLSFGQVPLAWGAVSIPWSTTFNCGEWKTTDGISVGTVNCDGMAGWGEWYCTTDSPSKEESITSAANHSSGDGGRGQRHWVGSGNNDVTGGLTWSFTSDQPELWIRWYMRYETGFSWNSLTSEKWWILDLFEGELATPGYFGTDRTTVQTIRTPPQYYSDGPNDGWATVMGGATGDGLWHLYEVHLKMDTDGTNGVAEMWIDETKILAHTNIDWGTTSGWGGFQPWASNAGIDVANARCYYQDFDDIAISNTGYIGPLAGVVGTPGRTATSGAIDELGW